LVVLAGEGRASPGHGAGAGREDAARALGEGPDPILRGRRARQARGLLPDGRAARRGPGVPAGSLHALLERLARAEIAGEGEMGDVTRDEVRARAAAAGLTLAEERLEMVQPLLSDALAPLRRTDVRAIRAVEPALSFDASGDAGDREEHRDAAR